MRNFDRSSGAGAAVKNSMRTLRDRALFGRGARYLKFNAEAGFCGRVDKI